MKKNKILIALIGAGAVGANLAEEAHHATDLTKQIKKAHRQAAMAPIYVRLPHGPEPESPSAPIQGSVTVVASSTAVGTPSLPNLSDYFTRSS